MFVLARKPLAFVMQNSKIVGSQSDNSLSLGINAQNGKRDGDL